MYIYDEERKFQVSQPIQSLVDLYLDGAFDFDEMLHELIKKYKIEGSLSNIKSIIQNNRQFKAIFQFERCKNYAKVFGEYGKRFPYELHIELTNMCNLNCPHCYKRANAGNISFLNFDDLKENILSACRGKTRVLHLTGGEPSLHPDFCEIVETTSSLFHLQLTTNGANLWTLPVSVIKKFSDIDISMYGASPQAYAENTGNLYAYNDFENTCKLLRDNNINFRITMVVNNKNIRNLDEYVVKAIALGASSFSFGLPTQTGRLIESPDDDWVCNREMINYTYRYIRMAKKKYENNINIIEWERDVYTHESDIFGCNYMLPCKGGTYSWWVNEKMGFRPCAMIPEEYILLSYVDWINYCENNYNIDWKDSYFKLKQFCFRNKITPADLCHVFKNEKDTQTQL